MNNEMNQEVTATISLVEHEERIRIAAYWPTKEQCLDEVDHNYKAFTNLMIIRKRIAVNLLKEEAPEVRFILKEMLEEYNKRIRQILAV